MPAFESNPFASLSLIAAPAVLTNASSVLVLSTSNRFARAIDRARLLSLQLQEQSTASPTPEHPASRASIEARDLKMRQLVGVERRSLILLKSLQWFYLSLGSLAAASLVSLFGSVLSSSVHSALFLVTLAIASVAGFTGVFGLVFGCLSLVRETRLALRDLSDETEVLLRRFETLDRSQPLA